MNKNYYDKVITLINIKLMGIYLGNITIKELEEKHSITLSDEHRSTLESMRQNNADNVKSDKFHIFDIPRVIACGSKDTAIKVYEILKQYSIKGHIEIAVERIERITTSKG